MLDFCFALWQSVVMNKNCEIQGCENKYYGKGMCRLHYHRKRITGSPFLRPRPKPTRCSVKNCERKYSVAGFCCFHYMRKRRGIPFDRPWGTKGHLNNRWNDGTSQYKNHYEMKIKRKFILERDNYKCFNCNGPAKEIHHTDLSKDNHSVENLVAACHKCNCNRLFSKKRKSKYRKIYGKTAAELAKTLNTSMFAVGSLHDRGKLITAIHNFRCHEAALRLGLLSEA